MAQAEADRRREIGARIKELRGRTPQPVIAERVGVTLRAYQEWEAGGGIAWDNLVKLAEVLDVSEDYIEYGSAGKGQAPATVLERIEAKVDQIIEILTDLDPEQELSEELLLDAHSGGSNAQTLLGSQAADRARSRRPESQRQRKRKPA